MSRSRSSSRGIRRISAGAAVAVAVLVAGAGGAMASQAPQRAVVPSVGSGMLAGATPLSATADDASVRISIILKPQRVAELQARVSGGYFHRGTFLTVPAFADRYGQSPATIKSLPRVPARPGAEGDRVPRPAEHRRDRKRRADQHVFAVKLKNYRVAATSDQPAQTVHGTTQMPTLPTPLAKATLGSVRPHELPRRLQEPRRSPRRCPRARPRQPPRGRLRASSRRLTSSASTTARRCRHVAELAARARRSGIVTLATAPVADVYSFWKQLNIPVAPNKISVRNIDGGAGKPSYDAGSDETALDMEQSGGIAPAAKVDRVPGAEHRRRLLRRVLHGREHNKAGLVLDELGRVRDVSSRPRSRRAASRPRTARPSTSRCSRPGAGPGNVRLERRQRRLRRVR